MGISYEADAIKTDENLQLNEKMTSLDIIQSEDDSAMEVRKLAEEMQQRCQALHNELQQFHEYLQGQKRERLVEFGAFSNKLKSEIKVINKLAAADPLSPKTLLGLQSANLSFYYSVWSYAKTCKSVTALGKRFYWVPGQSTPNINGKISTKGLKHKAHSAVVDIVASNGMEWIKVCSTTEKRIIWDLAKAGYAGSSDDDSDQEDESSDDDNDDKGLVKVAEALVKASKATRVRYRHPIVRMILPRIKAMPDTKEVAIVLQQIRNLGVIVQTADEMPTSWPEISNVLPIMSAERFEPLTDTLNVDCTILLAFVSDLSHGRVEPRDWHNRNIAQQIEAEVTEMLLPTSLWPTCGSRTLLTTQGAATRMLEIVEIIGTPTEKQRTALLFDRTLSTAQILEEFQKLSDYTIQQEWALPIQIMDDDLDTITAKLPSSVAAKVMEELTPINRSVFGYGWANGFTTISSNAIVAKQIEWVIEQYRTGDEVGPDIWLSGGGRSLVGKEKERRGGKPDANIKREEAIDASHVAAV